MLRTRTFHPTTALIILTLVALAGLGEAGSPPGTDSGLVAQDGWMESAMSHIQSSEYELSWHDSAGVPGTAAGYFAPNRAQDLRFAFTNEGILATSRTEPEWVLGLQVRGISNGSEGKQLQLVPPSVEANRAIYSRGELVEEYTNDPSGLLQSLRIASGPSAAGTEIVVGLELSGELSIHAAKHGVLELRHHDEGVLHFGWLAATDGLGRDLPVRFAAKAAADGGRDLSLVVGVENAVYPVEINATLKSLANSLGFSMQGSGAEQLGFSVATAGDVNGDGYSDVIVGAPSYDDGGNTDVGKVYVYHGSWYGPGSPAAADWTKMGPAIGAFFGWSVATAGDVNDDGYADVVIGAPHYTNGETDEGYAAVFHGSTSGLLTSQAWSYQGDQVGGYFGYSVAPAADTNADGYGDVVIGMPGFDLDSGVRPDIGKVFVFRGSSSGLSGGGYEVFFGDFDGDNLGHAVASAGDVNGDGYADVLMAEPYHENGAISNAGMVRLEYGGPNGLGTIPTTELMQNAAEMRLGYSLSTAGDINGDGYSDVIVGSFGTSGTRGGAYVYTGSASGLDTTPVWKAEGTSNDEKLGLKVSTAGDVNGDGYSDIIINQDGDAYGEVFLWLGSSGGLGADGTTANADWSKRGTSGDSFGAALATAGDVNGDGYGDIIIGSVFTNSTSGAAYGYNGGPDSLSSSPDWSYSPGQTGADLGRSVASLGDVNGDGYADFAVGASSYDSAYTDAGAVFVWYGDSGGPGWGGPDFAVYGDQHGCKLGWSVAGAGDVNGDGYSDLVIGIPYYTSTVSEAGRVRLYYGGAYGLTSPQSWSSTSYIFQAHLGYSVGAAGDVNGDGYGDLVAGAPGTPNGLTASGAVSVWLGGSSGLSTNEWHVSAANNVYLLGRSVGTAGDVNADGYSDLIASADEHAYVWHGSEFGLARTAAWHVSEMINDDNLGYAVSTAGDYNGDGYSDVVVGAPSADSDSFTTNDGKILLYFGSASGLNTSAGLTAVGGQNSAMLGYSVGTAGDIDGDGFSDLVAGAPNYTNGESYEGQVRLYYGRSLTFPPLTADWSIEGNQSNASFGTSVAGVGDINGDSYGDLLIGGALGGVAQEGTLNLLYGNGKPCRQLFARQLGPSGNPIAPRGASDDEYAFRLLLTGPPPLTGRGTMQFQTEGDQAGTVHDGWGTAMTVEADSGTSGITAFRDWGFLTVGTAYHWRARIVYDPVTNPLDPPYGRWIHPAWFGQNEASLRTAGNPALATEIFSDGFESGNTSAWNVHQ